MKFTYFKFRNFKGIEDQTLDLSKNPDSSVFALVGLNESGKTTILEAINYFAYKPESLDALGLNSQTLEDIHDLIPINKRDNFNDFISIEAGLLLEDDDISEIKKAFKKEHDINLTKWSNKITYTQKYYFENSIYDSEKYQSLWTYDFQGKKKRERKERRFPNEIALTANRIIISRIPSLLYFPNFLFEFPERIYLKQEVKSPKHIFYQKIIQDVLDSLENNTNIADHLITRITSEDSKEKRNLASLIGKMEKKLTNVIFSSWNEIFNKKISEKEIILYHGTDEEGPYIEFNIRDDVDTYRVTERSLGFKWYFVYILLTQFRTYRKETSGIFFLFDEPASNLHPSAQTELLKSFENLPKVLYTTHSHYLINPKWLENTFVIKNSGIDYDNEEEYHAKNTHIIITKYREFSSKYPNQTSYFQPILEILDYRPTNLDLVPKSVLTEGKNDFYVLKYYSEVIKEYKKPLNIIPGTSSSNLDSLISLFTGWGKDFLVLLDSDKEGQAQKQRYVDLFGPYVKQRIITFEDINSDWSNSEIEDLFEQSDKLKVQQSCYPDEKKFRKKMFNRSVQELLVKEQKVSLSMETHNNLISVLNKLKELLK